MGTYNTKNYEEQGGGKLVLGGLLDLSGNDGLGSNTATAGTLTFTNWTTLKVNIDGTDYYIPLAQTIAAT